MAYVYVWTDKHHIVDAQREYNKVIWQSDPDPKDFTRVFVSSDNDSSRHASVTRLDNDQVDWLSMLPKYIEWRVLRCSSQEEAVSLLEAFMKDNGYHTQ